MLVQKRFHISSWHSSTFKEFYDDQHDEILHYGKILDAFFIDPNVSSSFGYDAIDVSKTINDQSIHDNYLDNDKERFMAARMELLSSNPTYDIFESES